MTSPAVSPADARAAGVPALIQGGMGVGVSSWRLAASVARSGGLGVVSGVGPDLLLARMLQDGDPGGHVRGVLADYPDQELVAWVLAKLRWGPKPSQSWCTTRAPWAWAMATVSSVLPLSTTSLSAANGTLSRQRAMFNPSLWVMTTRERGKKDMP